MGVHQTKEFKMDKLLSTLETALETALRNGMSFKQLSQRIPAHVAKQLGITVQQFHAQLEEVYAVGGEPFFTIFADVLARKFTPAERAAIARRESK
jgi:hypothetical protein